MSDASRTCRAVDVLILIRSATAGPSLLSAATHLAASYILLPLTPSELSDPRDQHLLRLAKSGLNEASGRLWWSSGRDLTDSLDRTFKKRTQDGRPMWETVRLSLAWSSAIVLLCIESTDTLASCCQAEDRFFFNKHLQAPLINAAKQGGAQATVLGRFIIPVIFGSECRSWSLVLMASPD